jgi:hypothetical protein
MVTMRGNRRLHRAPHRAMEAQAVVISQQCESRGGAGRRPTGRRISWTLASGFKHDRSKS